MQQGGAVHLAEYNQHAELGYQSSINIMCLHGGHPLTKSSSLP